jgi:hypothetical protein
MKRIEIDRLALPADWRERAGAAFKDIAYREYAWHATYRAAWTECARRAKVQLGETIAELLDGIVNVKDARIEILRRENALLKAQLEELERLLP